MIDRQAHASKMPIVVVVSASIAGGCAVAFVGDRHGTGHHGHPVTDASRPTTIAVSAPARPASHARAWRAQPSLAGRGPV